MRGKVQGAREPEKHLRITPAYAGKSDHFSISFGQHQDHPRLCGEKYRNNHGMQEMLGSPPPMRGKDLHFCSCCADLRITPAYAGKSVKINDYNAILEDHPRLCGEK